MIYGDKQSDPLGMGFYTPNILAIMQSGNLYVYCTNNPVRYTDPTGNLLFPGEIHNAVSNRIIVTQALKGRSLAANVGIPTGEKTFWEV